MFTGIYTKIVTLILQILLVVACVLIFAYFDPFGLLSPKKQTLEDTPITVVSIREIGQLVTAEYYGEVLSSLQDTLIAEVKSTNKTLVDGVTDLNVRYIEALKEFYAARDSIRVRPFQRKKDLLNHFYNANPGLISDPFYQDMIETLIALKKEHRSEGELLLALSKDRNATFVKETYFGTAPFVAVNLVKQKEVELKELKDSRAFRKRQLIAIGRGWVKAGIDFGSFSERNFRYDKTNKNIYIFGIKPKILDYDINPWFIPEKKVKGFEIIAATNRASNAESLLKVKESCLNKLRTQAEMSGIITQAKINAEESLKNFFSLLIGEPIEQVRILETSLADFDKEIPKSGLFPKERLPLLDSIILSVAKIDLDSAVALTRRLSTLKVNTGLDTFQINRFSAIAYSVSEDKVITSEEWKLLKKMMRGDSITLLNSIWFRPKKKYSEIYRQVRKQTFDKYYQREIRFWYDSVVMSDTYNRFKRTFDSAMQINVKQEMQATRDLAVVQNLPFLKKSTQTIIVDRDTTLNARADIEARLDSLSKKGH